MDASQPLLLTAREAAQRLSLGKSTVYELANAGHIPHVRVGRSIRFPVKAIDEWVIRNTANDVA